MSETAPQTPETPQLPQMPQMPTTDRPASFVASADGTPLAHDVHDGDPDARLPVVVVVGGATMTRAMEVPLGQALAAAGLTAVTYDRRGRGESGDTAPYAVDREVEDVAAVLDAARPGGRGILVGFSSGAALALRTLAAGTVPLAAGVVFEPPYRLPDSPPIPAGYASTLEDLVARDRLDDAFAYFQTAAIGTPPEVVESLRRSPGWSAFAATARSLPYDAHCLGGDDHAFPTAMVASVRVPVLALASTGSPPFLVEPARLVGETGPTAQFRLVEGEFHSLPGDVLADLVAGLAATCP